MTEEYMEFTLIQNGEKHKHRMPVDNYLLVAMALNLKLRFIAREDLVKKIDVKETALSIICLN
jgi:hypothetical protein